jgi:hypothetical protein
MVIVGGVLEGFGFGLFAVQLARVQRQEFGWPRFLLRSWGWTRAQARRLLRRPSQVHAVLASMSGTVDVAGSLGIRKVDLALQSQI